MIIRNTAMQPRLFAVMVCAGLMGCSVADARQNSTGSDFGGQPKLRLTQGSYFTEPVAIERYAAKIGARVNSDRDYVFSQLPERLVGASYVKTRMDDKAVSPGSGLYRITATKPVEVVVALDYRATSIPDWLSDWNAVDGTVLGDSGNRYRLYSKKIDSEIALSGSKVPGAGAMYSIFIIGDADAVSVMKSRGSRSYLEAELPPVEMPVVNQTPKYDEFFTKEMEGVVDALVKRMTLDEKIKMLNGDIEGKAPKQRGGAGIDRLGIEAIVFYNGPRGSQMGRKSTLFPVGAGQAAAFSPENIEAISGAIAREHNAFGWDVLEAPSMNIIRDPLNGRNFEYYTEDPFLNGKLTAGFVLGVQRGGIVASAKHFIANNKETNRNELNAVVDERALYEIYLPAFKAAVDAGVLSIMTGANRVNGTYSSSNPQLISILKRDWGWPGFLYTDWNAAQSTTPSIVAGLDLSMPGCPLRAMAAHRVRQAYDEGDFNEEVLDDRVRRLLRGYWFAGNLKGAPERKAVPADFERSHKLAYEVAVDAMTLVKNEGKVLPIREGDLKIAVLGPMADKKFSEQSGGSPGVVGTPYDITALEGMKKKFGSRIITAPFEIDDLFKPFGAETGIYHMENGEKVPGFKALYSGIDPTSRQSARDEAVVEKIEFNWEMTSPNRQVLASDSFTAEWTGEMEVAQSGRYTLQIAGSQVVTVELDGETVANKHFIHPKKDVGIELEAGHPYAVKVTFRKIHPTVDSHLRISWIGPENDAEMQQVLQTSIAAAKEADIAVVCIGIDHNTDSEGMDRHTMRLPEYQNDFVEAVLAVNPRTVVVVYCGTPVEMDPWFENVPALVLPWCTSIENGNALAAVLSGEEDFGGRMPITFPKKYKDSPAHPSRQEEDKYDTIVHHESVFVGYRWYDKLGIEPLIPFGYGLSYADVSFSDLKLSTAARKPGEPLKVAFTVKNNSDRSAVAIPQLYFSDPECSLPRPPVELKGFERLELKPKETRQVELELNDEDFSFYSREKHDWVLEKGVFGISIRKSSRDLVLSATFEQK